MGVTAQMWCWVENANAILKCGTGMWFNYAMIFSTAGALQGPLYSICNFTLKPIDSSEKAERMPSKNNTWFRNERLVELIPKEGVECNNHLWEKL